jgi:archaeal type IV pilus assembly protein PilA
MVFTKKNEEAVSPVIGVILMVAITVILAAVIAAFVFGMAGNIQKTKVVATTLSRPNTSGIVVTYQGGQDAATLYGLAFQLNGGNLSSGSITAPSTANWQVNSGSNSEITPTSGTTVLPVGTSLYIKNVPTSSNFVVIGEFTDGTTQVLQQQNI